MVSSSMVILLIGLHGTGKSTFTRAATGRRDIEVGKGLVETTQTCRTYTFRHVVDGSPRRFTIIDTPGLADGKTVEDNLKRLQIIANQLRKLGQERVSGVIYFHSIESPKFDGIHQDNIRVLKAICGEAFFRHVAFVTTRWNRISRDAYQIYEDKHRQFGGQFQKLLPNAPDTFKFLNDGMSHQPVLEYFARLDEPGQQLQFVRELQNYMNRREVKISAVKKTTVGKQITAKRKASDAHQTFLPFQFAHYLRELLEL